MVLISSKTEKLLFSFIFLFGFWFGICYCFIFSSKNDSIKDGTTTKIVKSLISFLLLIFIWRLYNKYYIEIYKRYENGDVMKECIGVFTDPKYITPSGSRTLTALKYLNKYDDQYHELSLKDFYIPCSYKSYLVGGNSHGLANVGNIGRVIEKGSRGIHLDIYSDSIGHFNPSAKPVVRNQYMAKKYGNALSFEECCYTILNSSWNSGNNTPILLYLEFDKSALKNKFVMEKCGDTLYSIFGKKVLLQTTNEINNTNVLDSSGGDIGNIKISDALNKIIIITNDDKREGIFQELSWTFPKNNIIHFDRECQRVESLTGLYTPKKLDELKEKGKNEMLLLTPRSEYNFFNIKCDKKDLINPILNKCQKYGIQLVFTNYQLYDDDMEEYADFFQYEPIVLKEDELRYIPKPLDENEEYETHLKNLEEVKQTTQSGNTWVDFKI